MEEFPRAFLEFLVLVGIDPPEACDVLVIADSRQNSLRLAELVPEDQTLIRRSPLEDDVVAVCNDAVQFLKQLDPLLQIERFPIGFHDLVRASILESA